MKKVILVVDDEEIILQLLSEFFMEIGYDVITSEKGEEGLKYVKENPNISLVITDVKMAGMSGIDLLKMIREYRTDLPVIIITGYKTLDNAIAAIKYGASDYISKPFELEQVKNTIKKIFDSMEQDDYSNNLSKYLDEFRYKYSFISKDFKPEAAAKRIANHILQSKLCNPNEYNQFFLAFTEVFINALEHGNLNLDSSLKSEDFNEEEYQKLKTARLEDENYANKLIKIDLIINKEKFQISISDDGNGFDYKKILDLADDPILSLASFGRGFMYLNHLIDEFYFNEKGNQITLIKSFVKEG